MGLERELTAINRWLERTDPVALEHFGPGLVAETKADGTPVTAADRAIEEALRARIESEFPGDAILGEEQGGAGEGGRRWIIDPIDGTKNYARGIPAFATLVALEVDGVREVGVVSAPALRARWWATRGGGAYRDGRAIRVSRTARLADAQVCSGDAIRYAEAAGRLDGFLDLCRRSARHRGFGDFWGHMLVAEGAVDVMVEFPGVSVWDMAAVSVIVAEAGGRFSSLDGEDRIDAGDALATNGLLHDEVLALLRAR